MDLTELIATLGPVGGVALFMWLNRNPAGQKSDQIGQKLDSIVIQKLDALIEETKSGNKAMADMAKGVAILLDRSDR